MARKNKKKWDNSKCNLESRAGPLISQFENHKRHYHELLADLFLQEADGKVNSKKTLKKMRFLQHNLEGLAQNLETLKNESGYFADIVQTVRSARFNCLTLIDEIEGRLFPQN
jgi:hypothetical protein